MLSHVVQKYMQGLGSKGGDYQKYIDYASKYTSGQKFTEVACRIVIPLSLGGRATLKRGHSFRRNDESCNPGQVLPTSFTLFPKIDGYDQMNMYLGNLFETFPFRTG